MLVDENKFLDAIYCLVKKLEEREKEIAELK